MRLCWKLYAAVALAMIAAGCSNDSDKARPPDPQPAAYSITVTGADVVNKDSGDPVPVGGMPLAGGDLDVEP